MTSAGPGDAELCVVYTTNLGGRLPREECGFLEAADRQPPEAPDSVSDTESEGVRRSLTACPQPKEDLQKPFWGENMKCDKKNY